MTENPHGGAHQTVVQRQVRLLNENAKSGQLISLANAAFVTVLNLVELSSPLVIAWWVAASAVALIRLGQVRRYFRSQVTPDQAQEWLLKFRRGATMSGTVWSIGAFYFVIASPDALQYFNAFVMVGMVAGAVPILAVDNWTFRIFAIPITVAVGIGMLLGGSTWIHIAGATMVLVFLFAALNSANRFNQTLLEAYALQDENDTKAERLLRLNESLGDQVRERTAALQQANEELQRARHAADAANQAKSAFLANMSHEIRTPMNAILGMAHLMKADGVSGRQAEQLEKIDRSGTLLLGIINDVLDFSKIEAGMLSLEEAQVDLHELVHRVGDMVADRVRAKGLEMCFEIEPPPGPLVGDPTRLQQALLNYATNAVKFTEAGRIVLRVRLDDVSEATVLAHFEVEDTGIGLSPEQISGLFSPFCQADSSVTRKYGGTGLGLVIARRVAELMGGGAGVESLAGQGSRFWFTARLRRGHVARQEAPPPALLATKPRELAGRRVLLVEDEALNREIATAFLEKMGLQVTEACDGIEAVAAFEAMPQDLVLMDVQMPRMDGLEATRRIRALPSGQDVPILALTANAFDDDRQRCLEAGMSGFIGKPFRPEDLQRAVGQALTAVA